MDRIFKQLLDQEYTGENIVDIQKDIEDIIPNDIPQDEFGFHKGTFRVRVTWEADLTEDTKHVCK